MKSKINRKIKMMWIMMPSIVLLMIVVLISTRALAYAQENGASLDTEDASEAAIMASAHTYTLLDSSTAVVYTASELNDVLSVSNGITTVYLGADIALTAGITISPTKTALTIDGLYPKDGAGLIHSLTGPASTSAADTIGLRAASNLSLVVQNLNINGKNNSGLFYIMENASMEGVTLTFKKITYTGPQLSFHPNGITRFIDCTIDIVQGTGSSAQEVSEVSQAEIGGVTSITQNTSATYGVFSFRGSAPSLKILSDAKVNIVTNNHLVNTADALPVSVLTKAEVTMDTPKGVSYNASHVLSDVMIATQASVRILQNASSGYATMYCNGVFTVNAGASVYMQANYANAKSLIEFKGLNKKLNILNPRSVVFYNANAAALGFELLSATPITAIGTQVNYWAAALPLLDAGKLNDIPKYSWRKKNGGTVHIEALASSLDTLNKLSNLTDDELLTLPLLTTFQVQQARVLAVGNLPLAVDVVTDDQKSIMGNTIANANLSASYKINGAPYVFYGIADAIGNFAIPLPATIPVGTSITICANIPFMRTEKVVVCISAGSLVFQNVPENLSFGSLPIPVRTRTFGREKSDWSLTIEDSRIQSSTWRVYARMDEPLATLDRNTLPDAIIFVDEKGNTSSLGGDSILVYTGEGNKGATKRTMISWVPDRGILLRVNPAVVSVGKTYRATITWILSDAP